MKQEEIRNEKAQIKFMWEYTHNTMLLAFLTGVLLTFTIATATLGESSGASEFSTIVLSTITGIGTCACAIWLTIRIKKTKKLITEF